MNKVESVSVLYNLIALGARRLQMKTLEKNCAKIATKAHPRSVTEETIVLEQNRFGTSWRRAHMYKIIAEMFAMWPIR